MRRRFGPWLLAVALVVLSASAPGAQTPRDLSLSPAYGQISTDAGRAGQDQIRVVNLSDQEVSVLTALSPLEIDANGRFRAPTTSDLPSAVPWGAIEPSTFTLPAGNTRVITATFSPPAGTPAGGYYAAVRVTGTVGSSRAVELVHPVLMEVAGDGILTRRGRLLNLDVPVTSVRSTIPVTLTLENTGNVHLIARGRVVVLDAFSNETQTVPIAGVPILPNRTRKIEVSIDAPLVPWTVTAEAHVSFGRATTEVTRSASGYAIAWWGLAGYAIVLYLIARLLLALVRRRRRRRRPREAARVGKLPAEIAVERAELEEAGHPLPASAGAAWDDVWEAEPAPSEPEEELDVSAFAPPVEALEPEPALPLEGLPSEEEPLEDESVEVLDLSAVLQFEEAALEEELLEEEELEEEELEEEEPEEEEPEEEEPAEVEGSEPFFEEPEPRPGPPSIYGELEALEPPPAPEPEPEAEREPEPEPAPVSEPEPEPVERAQVRSFSRGAGLRRVRVALEMLGAEDDDTKLDVGLEMIESLRELEGVAEAVADAFRERREMGASLGGVALALDAIGSDRAPGALLEAYGGAKGPLAERLRAAIRTYPAEQLRAEAEAIASLPKKGREELGLR